MQPVLGNLGPVRFGLDEASFGALAQQVDLVVHCGAVVNYVLPYALQRGPNVLGTVECIRLAAQGRGAKFVHVSTLSALYGDRGQEDAVFKPVSPVDPAQKMGPYG